MCLKCTHLCLVKRVILISALLEGSLPHLCPQDMVTRMIIVLFPLKLVALLDSSRMDSDYNSASENKDNCLVLFEFG